MLTFYIRNILLGVGLAMDSGAVCIANGLEEPAMPRKRILFISILFGFVQGILPFIGYFVGYLILPFIKPFLPYLSCFIMSFLGIQMILESFQKEKKEKQLQLSFKILIMQAVATSIDSLSIGIMFAQNRFLEMLVAAMIFASITVVICLFALIFGKRFGYRFGKKAMALGGMILLGIGIEILLKGI